MASSDESDNTEDRRRKGIRRDFPWSSSSLRRSREGNKKKKFENSRPGGYSSVPTELLDQGGLDEVRDRSSSQESRTVRNGRRVRGRLEEEWETASRDIFAGHAVKEGRRKSRRGRRGTKLTDLPYTFLLFREKSNKNRGRDGGRRFKIKARRKREE